MITATAATRGIENQKRFSRVSRDRSRLLTRRSPSLNCRSVMSLRRESMRRSTSLFKASPSLRRASTFLVRVPLLPLQLVLTLGQAGHLRPPIILGGHVSSSLKVWLCWIVKLFLPEPRLSGRVRRRAVVVQG